VGIAPRVAAAASSRRRARQAGDRDAPGMRKRKRDERSREPAPRGPDPRRAATFRAQLKSSAKLEGKEPASGARGTRIEMRTQWSAKALPINFLRAAPGSWKALSIFATGWSVLFRSGYKTMKPGRVKRKNPRQVGSGGGFEIVVC